MHWPIFFTKYMSIISACFFFLAVGKGGVEDGDLQSSWRYAMPRAAPAAILSRVRQLKAVPLFPTKSKFTRVQIRFTR